MKKISSLWRRLPVILCGLAILTAVICTGITAVGTEADATDSTNYYYSQLSLEAKRFYDAIDQMNAQGLLKTGNSEYDLVENNVVSQAQLATFSSNASVLIAFGAARDAYSLDHPDLFYVDFSYLSVNVGKKGDVYVATLGTGRADNYYIEGGFKNQTEVDNAIAEYDQAINAAVAEAQTKSSVKEKIEFVNDYIADIADYDFCATATADGTVYTADAPFIRTSYGALVRNKIVCEGYARAFKAIMDRLDIPCVLVQGYALNDNGFEPHMWNYVKLDNAWYGIDVTWNDDEKSPNGYVLLGNAEMKKEHLPDGVVSESNFEFLYPALNPFRYGVTQEENGFNMEGKYVDYEDKDGNPAVGLVINVSYDGKNATELMNEGLYLAYRLEYGTYGGWTNWLSLCANSESTGSFDKDGYTEFNGVNNFVQYVQFAIIDYAPDSDVVPGGTNLITYDVEKLTERHIKNVSEPFGNATYGTYSVPPAVKSLTPENTAMLKVTETYDVTAVFTEKLVLADPDKEPDIYVMSQSANIADYVEIENFKWDPSEPDKISFTFTPSQMFEHNCETYSFYTVNLVGETSQKAPDPVSYSAQRDKYVCNRVYGDGRLYMKVYGQPALVGNEDLSLKGWTDKNGKHYAENQRSQLMLVANRPAKKQNDDMLGSAAAEAGVAEEEILSSSTYELDLQICGMIQQIPAGSFMQLSFGFPEGYGPEDEGVTFKVYHFKKDDNGKIDPAQTQELDCVITPYGLVVTVTEFSPFAIVALPADKVTDTSKAIYAQTVGFGGKVNEHGIKKVNVGESVTYTFTPEQGYEVDYVTLNGQSVDVNGNTLTLSYDNLTNNNVLEAGFVASRVAEREAAENIAVVRPTSKVVDPMGSLRVILTTANQQDTSASVTVQGGDTLVLNAEPHVSDALVNGDITYVWYKDGKIIYSEGKSELRVKNFTENDAGTYSVKAVYTYADRVKTAGSSDIGVSYKANVSDSEPVTGDGTPEGLSGGAIAGIVIACVVAAGGIAFAIVMIIRSKNKKKNA